MMGLSTVSVFLQLLLSFCLIAFSQRIPFLERPTNHIPFGLAMQLSRQSKPVVGRTN
jgi:hypothetical protein